MLRFDRYLVTHSRAIDLSSGNPVELVRTRNPRLAVRLYESRGGRTLIDLEAGDDHRVEVWERWLPGRGAEPPTDRVLAFREVLEEARLGAPRAFDVPNGAAAAREYLQRVFAREARTRGWVPITLEVLTALTSRRPQQWPKWLADRSLVVFVGATAVSGDAILTLLRLSRRDVRPHVLVRSLARHASSWPAVTTASRAMVVHEERAPLKTADGPSSGTPLVREAAARWALMLDETTGGDTSARAIELADVLIARDRPFEARAVLTQVPAEAPAVASERDQALTHIAAGASARAASRLGVETGEGRGWDMVDDFVGVLQICQDVEDEQAALASVGAFVRERLQAASVAFVTREGNRQRVLARIGSEIAPIEVAMKSIETGVAIPAARDRGPVESASPIRHAAEVIGAIWCRWSAGTPIATQQATTLLGVAAAAAAPSVRLAIARSAPPANASQPIPEIVGDSAIMTPVREAIVKAAASPFPVLIEGESGCGKELVARAIHSRSARRDRRFCVINCAALVDELVEAELFGHTRGAFTGAAAERAGVFEDANGGTLFMDEVAELGARVQAKLLRTLQEGEVRRVGESNVRKIDVRIVAATNRPLAREVHAGRFRQDLWYRLDVIRIVVPPLRARLDDLPVLAAHIWRTLAARTGSKAALSPAAVAALGSYDWPGNVRELQNVLASMLVSAPRAGLIGAAALPAHITRAAALTARVTLDEARRQFEERFVRGALARSGGRVGDAARELGLTRQGLAKLITRLRIDDPSQPSKMIGEPRSPP